MLKVQKLYKSFGGLKVIRDLDISINIGDIIGLIGPNGSGKTTLFNIISGILKPDSGKIIFNEKDITRHPVHEICKRGIARTFQLTKTFNHITAMENVMVGRAYGSNTLYNKKEIHKDCEEILELVSLNDKKNEKAGYLSFVDRKKLEIARALATKPQLLLLDETMAGLNPEEMKEAITLIKRINKLGITLFVIEHAIKAMLKISNKIIVLNTGQKIAEGPPQNVINNKNVIKAYIGEKKEHQWNDF